MHCKLQARERRTHALGTHCYCDCEMDEQTRYYHDLQISMNPEIMKPNVKDADTGKPKCLWGYNLIMGGVENQNTGGWIILN